MTWDMRLHGYDLMIGTIKKRPLGTLFILGGLVNNRFFDISSITEWFTLSIGL